MSVIDRDFFNLTVLHAPMAQLAASFAGLFHPILSKPTPLALPPQSPYHAAESDPPWVLWSPLCAPQLTAYMPRERSGDYFVVSYASERFGISLVSLRSATPDRTDPINEFIAHEGKKEKPRRVVRAMLGEPRWDFYTEGEPLPFEDVHAYKARRIRDRFTREMLLSYTESWGAPVRNPDFWRAQGDAMTLVRTRRDR